MPNCPCCEQILPKAVFLVAIDSVLTPEDITIIQPIKPIVDYPVTAYGIDFAHFLGRVMARPQLDSIYAELKRLYGERGN